MISTASYAVAGIVVARTLGPEGRGHYAAVLSWYFTLLVIGEVGLTSAVCYYVARHRTDAADYVATARRMILASGAVFILAGMLLAPVLARFDSDLANVYRLAFAVCAFGYLAGSYSFALQAVNVGLWNLARVSAPTVYLCAVCVFHWVGGLDIFRVVVCLGLGAAADCLLSYCFARRLNLAGGAGIRRLVRPLGIYGLKQVGSAAPTLANARLDQLVLSQTVRSADLGLYSAAVTVTSVAVPAVSAIGSVVFPKIASRSGGGKVHNSRIEKRSIALAGIVSIVVVGILALGAPILIPLVFGSSFSGAVLLTWILAPGGVFLACGQVASDVLRGHDRALVVARAQIAGALITVVGLVLLVPHFGVIGAAVTSSIAYGFALVLMLIGVRSSVRLERAASSS